MNTNTTQTVDERCVELAREAFGHSAWVVIGRQRAQLEVHNPSSYAGNLTHWLNATRRNKTRIKAIADRIIALRTAEAAREDVL